MCVNGIFLLALTWPFNMHATFIVTSWASGLEQQGLIVALKKEKLRPSPERELAERDSVDLRLEAGSPYSLAST